MRIHECRPENVCLCNYLCLCVYVSMYLKAYVCVCVYMCVSSTAGSLRSVTRPAGKGTMENSPHQIEMYGIISSLEKIMKHVPDKLHSPTRAHIDDASNINLTSKDKI